MMNRDYIKANRVLREEERIDMQRHTVIGEQEAAKRGLSRAVQLLVPLASRMVERRRLPGRSHRGANSARRPHFARRRHIRFNDRNAPAPRCDFRCRSQTLFNRMGWNEFDPKVVKYFLLLNSDNYELRTTNYESKEQPVENQIELRQSAAPEIEVSPNGEPEIGKPQVNDRQDSNEQMRNEQQINESPISDRQFDNHPFQNQSISESRIAERQTDEQKINS
jgi:hypothetical protein